MPPATCPQVGVTTPWAQVPSPHSGRQPWHERTRCPRAVLPEPETHSGFPSHRAATLLSETTQHGKSVFPWCKWRCSSALTSLRENCPQSAVRQQVSPQHHRHGPGQDTTPKEPQQPHRQPPGPRASASQEVLGNRDGQGGAQPGSKLAARDAGPPWGLPGSAELPWGPSLTPNDGIITRGGGCSAGCDGPLPHPVLRQAGLGEGTQDTQPARLQGQHGADTAVTSARPSRASLCAALCPQRPACVGGETPGGLQPAVFQEAYPASSLNPRETRKQGVPDGPTRSLMGPQSPASRPPRAGFRPSSAAPRGALLALLRQPGPWALVPTTSPPAVKTASKGSPAALSSLKGLARPSPRGRGAHSLWARAPVWTGGEPQAELRPNADRRRPPAGTAGGPRKSTLCWA